MTMGLSPRLRGNLDYLLRKTVFVGSIPAPAGEPQSAPRTAPRTAVYPRACGGTRPVHSKVKGRQGLSPRLRGNHRKGEYDGLLFRSIPAPAGEPSGPYRSSRHCKVYPRACGGTWGKPLLTFFRQGLSPRLRGNLFNHTLQPANRRSIPAPAGEPVFLSRRAGGLKVYPRACGGTGVATRPGPICPGLSPRLRGNRRRAKRHPG